MAAQAPQRAQEHTTVGRGVFTTLLAPPAYGAPGALYRVCMFSNYLLSWPSNFLTTHSVRTLSVGATREDFFVRCYCASNSQLLECVTVTEGIQRLPRHRIYGGCRTTPAAAES